MKLHSNRISLFLLASKSTGKVYRNNFIKGIRYFKRKLTREELLEALVDPSARLALGYGSVILTLENDQTIFGVLLEETENDITLKTSEVEPLKLALTRIKNRENVISSMPPIGTYIGKRALRDLVEYLSNLTGEEVKTVH
ncbi:hypothetical protein [Seonamhaeicola maritimus]|uniref:hypothetical protein n=1 Tax=Seonamhaeicola maritimus TaxID=2591822 RepID=UPI002493EF41|nr:hypothetical protein [Seonamhaeicola maritimus]